MDKLKMQTPDLTDKNIERLAALFPHVITETKDESRRDGHEKYEKTRKRRMVFPFWNIPLIIELLKEMYFVAKKDLINER